MTDHVRNLETLAKKLSKFDTVDVLKQARFSEDSLSLYMRCKELEAAALHAYAAAMPWLVEADAARAATFRAGGGPGA